MQRTPEPPIRPRAAVERALHEDRVVWLSSVRADGSPHLAPVWFHWDGERIFACSKPAAVKVRNLQSDPRVMLAIGTPGVDFDVELIEAEAELPQVPCTEIMPTGFGEKYRAFLQQAGMTARRFAEVYSQPIVLKPVRFLGYGGRGWAPSPASAA